MSCYVAPWGFCMMPPTAIITLSTLTSRLIPQRHQKTLNSTGGTHRDHCRPCRAASLGEGGGEQWLSSVFAAGRVTVGVRGSLSLQLRLSLSRLAFRGSKKGFDEEDSEAPRHLAAATLPSTSWGPAELLCGGQRRETRCILWSKHRLRRGGAVQVTPSVGVLPQRSSLWRGEGWRWVDVVQLYVYTEQKDFNWWNCTSMC